MASGEAADDGARTRLSDAGRPAGVSVWRLDVGRNTGFVNIGTDHDTGTFAVASIRGWWRHEGQRLYPSARTILITADAGGSNGWRLRSVETGTAETGG